MKKKYFYMLAGAMSISAACNSDLNSYEVKVKPVESVTIREQPFSLYGGQDSQLFVTILPTDATKQQIVWRSADPATIRVSDGGKITAAGVGTAAVYAVSVNGAASGSDNITAQVSVSVYDSIMGVAVRDTQVYKGRSVQLRASIIPARTTNQHITWLGLNDNIATVDAHGLLRAGQNIGKAKVAVFTDAIASRGHTTKTDTATVEVIMPFSELDKTGWTVTTVAIDQNGENYKYMWDGGDAECTTKDAHITGNPEHIFDDMANTYLCFVKPGGNRLGIELPATANAPYFVVDMQQEQAFNAIKWVHRNGSYGSATNKIAPVLDFEGRATGALGFVGSNNYAYLHVFGIILEGSNDNETFTIIPPTEATNEDNIIWIPQSPNTYRSGNAASPNPNIIPVTQSTYRYLRVTCKVHSRNYGNGEGKYVHPDDNSDVAVSTGGETMQVAEFGVGSEIIFDDQE